MLPVNLKSLETVACCVFSRGVFECWDKFIVIGEKKIETEKALLTYKTMMFAVV